MQKKLIALAVAGVASTAAFAQSNVTIYGDLKPSFDSMKVEGQNGRFNSIDNNNSNIGFKGEEALGNGLKAIFQIESGISLATEAAPQGGTFGGRNTFVGLKGGFGEATMGRRDTAYKTATGSFDPFADTIGDYNNIMGSAFGTSALLDQRPGSSFNYYSPALAGFKVSASYAMVTDNATTAQDDNIFSSAVTYDIGGLNLVGAYEKQAGSAVGGTAVANNNREGWKLGAKYTFGPASVFGLYEEIEQKDSSTTSRKRDAFHLGGTYAIGAIDLLATYIKADKESGTGAVVDSGATNWNLGARYNLSKRTNVMAIYTDLDNKAGANYSLNMKNGMTSGAGLDAKGFSVRVQHKF